MTIDEVHKLDREANRPDETLPEVCARTLNGFHKDDGGVTVDMLVRKAKADARIIRVPTVKDSTVFIEDETRIQAYYELPHSVNGEKLRLTTPIYNKADQPPGYDWQAHIMEWIGDQLAQFSRLVEDQMTECIRRMEDTAEMDAYPDLNDCDI